METSIGDLVRVAECDPERTAIDGVCECFFCTTDSNRVGLVLGPAPRDGWAVQFDTGQWRVYPMDFENGEVEVVSNAGR